MSEKNFPINQGRDGVVVTAGTAGTPVQLFAASDTAQMQSDDLLIDNPGPLDVYIQAGGPGMPAATARSVRVPANSLQAYQKGSGTNYLAAYASAAQPIVVHVGNGA